jgi:hypothetical protein
MGMDVDNLRLHADNLDMCSISGMAAQASVLMNSSSTLSMRGMSFCWKA